MFGEDNYETIKKAKAILKDIGIVTVVLLLGFVAFKLAAVLVNANPTTKEDVLNNTVTEVTDDTTYGIPIVPTEQSDFTDGEYRLNTYTPITQGTDISEYKPFELLLAFMQDCFANVGYDTTGLPVNITSEYVDENTKNYIMSVDDWLCIGQIENETVHIEDFYKTSSPTDEELTFVAGNMQGYSLQQEGNVWRLNKNE
jgi:hypothetical protein